MPTSPQEVAPDGTAAAAPAPPAGVARTSPPAQTRLRAVALVVAVLGVLLLAALLVLGGGEAPPATGAAALVPSDALLYVHLSTDRTRPAVQRMDAALRRLPDHGTGPAALAGRLLAVVGGHPGTTFASLAPWLGREAAFAVLAGSATTADSEIVLDVRARGAARTFVTREGAAPIGGYRSVPVLRYPTGAELAFVGHYLVVGTDAVVHAAIDTERDGRSLAADAAYGQAMSDAPDGRALDAYLSGDGVSRVLGPRGGLLGALGALLTAPGLRGTAFSVTATAPGLAVHEHGVTTGAGRGAGPFSPSLAAVMPAGSPLLIEGHGLRAMGPRLFSVMGSVGLMPSLRDLLARLGGTLVARGVDVGRLLDLFGGDTAVGLAAGHGAPALVIVTRTTDMAAARRTLAGLEAALGSLFAAPASGPGVAPTATDATLDGVTVHEMHLGPGLSLDLAVFRGLVVVATNPRGVADVAARAGSLGSSAGYSAVLGNRPDQVATLGFFDPSQLLGAAEQTQLPRDAGFVSLEPDLAHVRNVGMNSAGEGTDTTAELLLQIP